MRLGNRLITMRADTELPFAWAALVQMSRAGARLSKLIP